MRARHRVYLGLGSNLGDRIASLRAAIHNLEPIVTIDAMSSVWDTAPEIVEDQPRYLNAVAAGWTDLDPFALLHAIKRIERTLGRQPAGRYGPRAIDIDILLYGDWRVDSKELVIPHPLLPERAFVLEPLSEIAPHVIHPRLGQTIVEMLKRRPPADVRRVAPPFI